LYNIYATKPAPIYQSHLHASFQGTNGASCTITHA
jgi:hypothetical protein